MIRFAILCVVPNMNCVTPTLAKPVGATVSRASDRMPGVAFPGKTVSENRGENRKDRAKLAPMTDRPTQMPTPMTETLGQWIIQVADQRDREAFAALFDYFAPRLKAYMMRGGSDPVSAEEFAQETMLTVWRKADRFDANQASASTWIFTIARNKRIDAYRRRARPEFDPQDPLLQPVAEPQPDDSVAAVETAAALRDAVAELPEEQASLLTLAFYEDLAHSEIAARTGLPLGTVKSRLRLAIGKLRNALGELRR